jgi:MoaA/NifB/PqqE/SkfB family radical SAM enzyme
MLTRNSAWLEGLPGRGLTAHLELTYRCGFDCVHCYCGKLRSSPELPLRDVERLLGRLRDGGVLWLALTGGECLLREDFPEIYLSAKRLGFLVSVLTNGSALEGRLDLLRRSPPFSIDATLNGVSEGVFDAVTRTRGRLGAVMRGVERAAAAGLRLTVKFNLMKANAGEIAAVKGFADSLPGRKPGDGSRFRLDPNILPGLEGDSGPCSQRLTGPEIDAAYRRDPDLRREHERFACLPREPMSRDGRFLYHCDSWKDQFFISPQGFARFCVISAEYGGDLLRRPPREVLAGFGRLRRAVFRKGAACASCSMRAGCLWCPAKASQETGDAQAQVGYYCALARHERN